MQSAFDLFGHFQCFVAIKTITTREMKFIIYIQIQIKKCMLQREKGRTQIQSKLKLIDKII